MSQIQLFSYPTSPYAQKVNCYLKYKQLDFSFVPVNPLNNEQIRFTQQRQVPVLQIGNEWRKDSSKLGKWLDEVFPENPLLPDDVEQRNKVLAVDDWISKMLIPSGFRYAVDWQSTYNAITNGWKLARAVNNATPMPMWVRVIWPFAVKRAKFITRMVNELDRDETLAQMNSRLQAEFLNHLEGGPYLAGQSKPSLADLSAFPIVTSGYFMGMRVKQSVLQNSAIRDWAVRVHTHLPENPLLVPDDLLAKREL